LPVGRELLLQLFDLVDGPLVVPLSAYAIQPVFTEKVALDLVPEVPVAVFTRSPRVFVCRFGQHRLTVPRLDRYQETFNNSEFRKFCVTRIQHVCKNKCDKCAEQMRQVCKNNRLIGPSNNYLKNTNPTRQALRVQRIEPVVFEVLYRGNLFSFQRDSTHGTDVVLFANRQCM
jgi:hypothetical protein